MECFVTKNTTKHNNLPNISTSPLTTFEYIKLHNKLTLNSNRSKIKSTIILVLLVLKNSISRMQTDGAIFDCINIKNNIDFYYFLAKHCKPTKNERKRLINEFVKIAIILNSVYANCYDSAEKNVMIHFPDVDKNKYFERKFRELQKFFIAGKLEKSVPDFDKHKMLKFYDSYLKYQYLDIDCKKPMYNFVNESDDSILKVFHILRNAEPECKNMLEEMQKLKEYFNNIYQPKDNNKKGKKDEKGEKLGFAETNIATRLKQNPVQVMLNPIIRDLCYEDYKKEIKKYGPTLLFDEFVDDEFLMFTLCTFIKAITMCKDVDTNNIRKNIYSFKLFRQLYKKDFFSVVSNCKIQVTKIFDLLNRLWNNDFDGITDVNNYFDNIFESISELCQNTYFKSLIFIHCDAQFGSIKDIIVRIFCDDAEIFV